MRPSRIHIILWSGALVLLGYSPAYARQDNSPKAPQGGPAGRAGQRGGPSDEEKERSRIRIGMTKEQQAQIEAIYADADKRMRGIFEDLREKHTALIAVYDTYEIDRTKERALMREISALRWQLLRIHSENEGKIRSILSRDQFDKLRAVMKEEMEKAMKNWRPPRGGRGGSPPPGGRP